MIATDQTAKPRQSAPLADESQTMTALGQGMTPMPVKATGVASAPQKQAGTPKGVASPLQGGVNPIPTNPVPASPAPTPLGEAMTPLPVAPQGMGAGVASGGASGLGPGAQGTPTNPANPLTAQTISRAPTADRFQLAQDRYQQFIEQTSPAYQAANRDALRAGAAAGGLGSGQLRTSLGDLANQRDLNMRTAERGFLTDALEGTIADSFGDVAIGQQQQGFQNQQQQQAFENELRRIGFTEDMINSAFGRNQAMWNAGQAGGTGSGTGLAVGGNTQAGGDTAIEALMNLIRNQGAAGTTPPFNPAAGSIPAWRF